MEHADTGEKGFQKLIVKELIEKQGYIESVSNDFDREFCLNVEQLMQFIRASQPEAHETIQKKGERAFLVRLDDRIRKEGVGGDRAVRGNHFRIQTKRSKQLCNHHFQKSRKN